MGRPSAKRFKQIALLFVMVCVVYAVASFVTWYREFNNRLSDTYAAMQVGLEIARYIEGNGKFPRGWPDIGDLTNGSSNWQQRVTVDWKVRLKDLASAKSHEDPPFPVVRCRSGSPTGPVPQHDANLNISLSAKYVIDERAKHGAADP